jgi:hypothetical protein
VVLLIAPQKTSGSRNSKIAKQTTSDINGGIYSTITNVKKDRFVIEMLTILN